MKELCQLLSGELILKWAKAPKTMFCHSLQHCAYVLSKNITERPENSPHLSSFYLHFHYTYGRIAVAEILQTWY